MSVANYERPVEVITNSQMTCVRLNEYNEGARRAIALPSPLSPVSHGLSGGHIAGIIVGFLAGVTLITALAYWSWRRRKKGEEVENSTMVGAPDTEKRLHEVSGISTAELRPDAQLKSELSPDAASNHELSSDAECRHELSPGAQTRPGLSSTLSHRRLEMEGSVLEPVELPGHAVPEHPGIRHSIVRKKILLYLKIVL